MTAPTGMSLTAKLFTVAAPDVEVTGNTITVTERANAKPQYVSSIVRATVLPAGNYTLILFSGSTPVSIGKRTFLGIDAEEATTTAELAVLDSATLTKIDSILEDTGTTLPSLFTILTTKVRKFFQLSLRKDAAIATDNATELAEINASGGTGIGGFLSTTDSQEAIRDATGSGGGSATLANQELILDAIDAISADQLAAITVESGVIGNFPETLTIGDSYTENTGQIKIVITDSVGDPITEFGSLQLSEADISFTAFRPNDSAVLSGTCEFVDDITETYVLLTLPSSETSLGKAEYTYEGRLKFFWEGPSSGESDDEQKTYKTTPFKFIANP